MSPSTPEQSNAPRPHGDRAAEILNTLAGLLRATSVHRRRMKFIGGLRKDHRVYLPRWSRHGVVRQVDRVREIVVVQYGKMRVEVPFEDISWIQPLDGGSRG